MEDELRFDVIEDDLSLIYGHLNVEDTSGSQDRNDGVDRGTFAGSLNELEVLN